APIEGGLGAMRLPILLSVVVVSLAGQGPTSFLPQIPRTWDDGAMADLELPLPRVSFSLQFVKSEYYYRIPVRPLYRTIPEYAPDGEPEGYLDKLRQVEPAVLFDPAKLKTEQDWIRAGELVFDSPISLEVPFSVDLVRNPDFVKHTGAPVASDGTLPNLRY